MWYYVVTIFLSAFLLFQVQLVFAKYILPWYGGVPAVWTTCMLFFQCALLLGYVYAHWLDRRRPATQRGVHLAALVAGLAALTAAVFFWGSPLLPDAGWRPRADDDPVWHIVRLLAVCVALPFLTLAATAPLLQRWFNRTERRSPYRLYAVSNLGSLAALLTYPFLVEALIPLRQQALYWTVGYVLFALGVGTVALRAATRPGGAPATRTAPTVARPAPPAPGQYLLWLALAACASVLLLAITNQVSQEIAPVPLLWVLPLAIYLLSFVLCFESDRWYRREVYLALLVPALALATLAIQHGVAGDLLSQVLLYVAVLFVCCMVCHGELARQRPAPRYLTGFYLTLTAGGAAGGLFVGVLAPHFFPGYWELSLGLWGCAALALTVLLRDKSALLHRGRPGPAFAALFAMLLLAAFVFAAPLRAAAWAVARLETGAVYGLTIMLAVLLLLFYGQVQLRVRLHRAVGAGGLLAPPLRSQRRPARRAAVRNIAALGAALAVFGLVHVVFARDALNGAVAVARNFFGVLYVEARADDRDDLELLLRHGRTLHGRQSLAAERRGQPNGYYAEDSGVGRALRAHPRRRAGGGVHIGVVGLGTGTLAAYGRAGDRLRFYEINPAVVALAQGDAALFTYLKDTRASVQVVLGDARISLERELARGESQRLDVLALDAFNSDSIPIHLLTREAFAVYLAHLAEDGVLAIHISNRYLDLEPAVARQAAHFGLAAAIIQAQSSDREWTSVWMLLARRADILPADAPRARTADVAAPLWTDDYSNILPALTLARSEPEPAGGDSLPAASSMLDFNR